MNTYFLIAFILCLVGYIFHTLFHFFEYKGYKVVKSKIMDVVFHLVMITGYLGWGFMIFSDPIELGLSNYIAIPSGLLVGLTGIVFFVFSSKTKKGFSETDNLVTYGVYSKIRHPMYLGIILIHLGFPLAARSLLTLLSAIIWILIIFSWKYMEEKDLGRKFGDKYAEYKKRTFF